MSATETTTAAEGAPAGQSGRKLTTARAMAEGIAQEMERDADVVVLGEDIGNYGGIFGSTTGLLEKFGRDRVLDTPISETAFIGLGIGAAVEGMRQVVVPSNPADAKGLMISAIRDDNPVVYMFHKGIMGLPWMAKNPRSVAPVPEEPYETPIGKAAVARAGSDATVVTLSLSVHHALDVAEKMAAEHGVDLEVIDLRSLVPLDADTVLSSVARTGRLLVVDEDYQSFGLSGEIAARVAETDPGLLRAPLRRVAVPDVPIPYARSLERAVLPTPERIEAAVRDLCKA